MRSLFGALFGLIIGIFVSAFLKSSQLFEVLKEVFKTPYYLSLIIAFVIFGWVIGLAQWEKARTISSEKEGYNSIEWEGITILILVILGALVSLSICKWLALVFIFLNEILWIFWLLLRHDRLNCKWFRKSQSSGEEDKKK